MIASRNEEIEWLHSLLIYFVVLFSWKTYSIDFTLTYVLNQYQSQGWAFKLNIKLINRYTPTYH